MEKDPLDPKGLIREAYRIAGITAGECRTIFLDWALGVAEGQDAQEPVKALLVKHAQEPDDHPMTQTLIAALAEAPRARRRGGRAARVAR